MKKLITLLVAFALLFNLSSVCVIAEDASEVTEPVSFELLSALGIDNGINTDGSASVTRAEFAAMAVRAANMDEYSSYDGSFADVGSSHPFANEIYTAKNMKLTNGTAEGIFSPDGPVSRDVAIKMTLVAMGYETMAITYGGYPLGYNIIESRLNITLGISSADSLSVNDAKTIINNALTKDVAIFGGIEDGNLIYTTKEGVNLLTERFNLRKISGVVTKAGYLSVGSAFSNDNFITISGNSYESLISPEAYFGINVNAWIGKIDNKVYAIETTGTSKVAKFDASDIESHANSTLKVYEGTKTRSYKTSPGLSFIENGRFISHTDSDFIFPDGTLTLIDSEGNGTYDYAIAEKLQYFVITSINKVDEVIYDKNSPGISMVELEADDEIVCNIIDANGNYLDFESLKENTVVTIAQSYDKKVNTVYVGSSRVIQGTLNEIGDESIVIDDTEYRLNTYYTSAVSAPKVGRIYTFYIAADDTVTYVDISGSDSASYAYYLDFARQTVSMENLAIIRLLNEANEIVVYELADKITLNNTSMPKSDSRIDTAFLSDGNPIYQLVRYTVDSNEKINMLDTPDTVVNTSWELASYNNEDRLTQYTKASKVNYRGGNNFGAPGFSFTKSTIFIIPDSLRGENPSPRYDDEAFQVTDTSYFNNNDNYYVDAYDFNENYYPEVIAVYGDTVGEMVSGAADAHLVYSVTDAATPDGDTTKLIRTYSGGHYYRYYADPEKVNELTIPTVGDIVRLSLNTKSYITNIAIDVEYDAESKVGAITYSGEWNGITNYITGKVKSIGNGSIVLRADSYPRTLLNDSNIAPLGLKSNTRYVIFNLSNNTVEIASSDSVLPENVVGAGAASYVICKLNYYAVTDVIIYRN